MKFIKICAIKKTVSTFNVHNKEIQEIKQHCYYYQNLIKKPPIVTTEKEDFDALKSKELLKKMMWNSRSMSNHLNGVGFHRTLKSIIFKKSEILFYNQTNRHLDSILNYEYVFILFAF